MLEGDTTIYAISNYSANQIYASRAELLDLNIFQGNLSDVVSFSLYKDDEHKFTVEADANPDIAWIITHPVLSKADIGNADEMINNLLDLSRDEYVDVNPEDLSIYGLDEPSYSITINIDEFDTTMLIGREDRVANKFYARMSDSEEVFTIDASTMTFLDNEAIDMVYAIPYLPRITNVKSVDINITGLDNLLLEISYNADRNMLDYSFNGTMINMVAGAQTWGSFFFQQMISVPVIELDPEWEISGEPYARLVYTYTDEVFETIEYYERDADTCYFVRNGYYSGLVVDRTYLSRERGFPALVELVLNGSIYELLQENQENQSN